MEAGSSSIGSRQNSAIAEAVAIAIPHDDSIMATIKEIWLDVLCLDAIGTDDDFLLAGGESISAVRAVNRVNEALQIAVPVKGLYENSTLGRFYQYVLSFVSVAETGSI